MIRSLPLDLKTYVFEHKAIIQLTPFVVKHLFKIFIKNLIFYLSSYYIYLLPDIFHNLSDSEAYLISFFYGRGLLNAVIQTIFVITPSLTVKVRLPTSQLYE